MVIAGVADSALVRKVSPGGALPFLASCPTSGNIVGPECALKEIATRNKSVVIRAFTV
jgi:hypothetical protein